MKLVSSIKKNQLKYFVLGPVIAIVGGSSNFIVAYDITFYPFNPFIGYLAPFFNITIAYAITTYKLLGLRVLARIVVSPVVSFLITVGVLFLYFQVLLAFGKFSFTNIEVMIYSICAIPMFFGVYKATSLLIGKIQPQNNYEELLFYLTRRLGELSSQQEIVQQIVDVLQDKDSPQSQSLVLLWQRFPEQPYTLLTSYGIQSQELHLSKDSHLIEFIEDEYIRKQEQIDLVPVLIKDELHKIYGVREDLHLIIKEIEQVQAELCIPLIYETSEKRRYLLGVVCLGEPVVTDVYSQEDYEFFKTLALELVKVLVNTDARDRVVKMERLAYLGKMAMGWVHQINNILHRISFLAHMNADLLTEELNPSAAEEQQPVCEMMQENEQIIEDNAIKGGYIAEGLLKLTKTVKERDFEKINIHDIIEESTQAVRDQQRLGYVTVINEVDPALPPIDGITHCLEEAFNTLLHNAARAVMKCREENEASINIRSRITRDKRYVEIAFSDNGCGMTKEDLNNLGTPLFMPSNGSAPEGHGIGVAIAYYYIMNVHNGRIEASSEIKKGTTFYISLPIIQLSTAKGEEENG